MTQETQKPWPRLRDTATERRSPVAFFANPDGFAKSSQSVAGALRLGTSPGAGPSGAAPGGRGGSDMGMDRLENKPVDRIGVKYPETDAKIDLISKELRGDNRRKD